MRIASFMEDIDPQQTADTNISHTHLTLLVIRTILIYTATVILHIILLVPTCIKMKREFMPTPIRENVLWIFAMLTIVRGKFRSMKERST
jgi:hypothetical protein